MPSAGAMVGSRLMQRLARLSTAQNQPRKAFKDAMATVTLEYERAIQSAHMAIMGNEVDDSRERYDVACMEAEFAVVVAVCAAWSRQDPNAIAEVARMTCHFLLDAEFSAEVFEIAQRLRDDKRAISVMLRKKCLALMACETMQDECKCEQTYYDKCVVVHGVIGNAGVVMDAIAARANGQTPDLIFARAAEVKRSHWRFRALCDVFADQRE